MSQGFDMLQRWAEFGGFRAKQVLVSNQSQIPRLLPRLARSQFVSTGRPDRSICKWNAPIWRAGFANPSKKVLSGNNFLSH